MRVTRSLLLLLVAALVMAGCAQLPVGPVAAAPPSLAAPSIDSTYYGPLVATPPGAQTAVIVAPADTERGFLVAGPVSPAAAAAARDVPLAYASVGHPQPYTLDTGDRLRIVVFGQDGLSNSYVVDAGGYIAMPLIGSVRARGTTTDQLSARVAEKLRQGFIKEPHVAVEIEAYRPFFILGEVAQPGQYPYVADMTVETAVAIAGGFGARAYRRTVKVTRVINGEQVRLTVPANFPLRPGDTVNVQERWF